MDERLAQWQGGEGFRAIKKAWLHHAHELGTRLTVGGETGNFAGLADDGSLLIDLDDGTRMSIHAGDVGTVLEREANENAS
jgi:BirA family biotin operon repressor/biotin-[acetyl-CoA-carboxylase] ligase